LHELHSSPGYGSVSNGGKENEKGYGNGRALTTLQPSKQHLVEEKSSLKLLVRNAKGEAERSAIARALEQTHWNRKAAARLLNVSYRALLYKIQEYNLTPPADSARLFGTGDLR